MRWLNMFRFEFDDIYFVKNDPPLAMTQQNLAELCHHLRHRGRPN